MAAALTEGLEGVGLTTTVLVRTAAARSLPEPIGDALDHVDAARFAPEEVAVSNGQRSNEVYLSLPGGTGRSKLAASLAQRSLATATVRNWNTVVALHDLAGG